MCADGPQQGEPASFSTVPSPAGHPLRARAALRRDRLHQPLPARRGAKRRGRGCRGRRRLSERGPGPAGPALGGAAGIEPADVGVAPPHGGRRRASTCARWRWHWPTAGACERGAGLVPDLKWPNDLMVGGRKLGGILAEPCRPARAGATGPAVVVGLGLNVGWPPPGSTSTILPPRLRPDEVRDVTRSPPSRHGSAPRGGPAAAGGRSGRRRSLGREEGRALSRRRSTGASPSTWPPRAAPVLEAHPRRARAPAGRPGDAPGVAGWRRSIAGGAPR